MEPGAILALICSGILLVAPRRWAITFFLAGAIYCPMGAAVSVGSIGFPPVRLLSTAGLLRLLVQGEFPQPHRIDRVILAYGALMVWSGLFHEGPLQAIVLRCGYAIDTVGAYYVFRSLIRSHADLIHCFASFLILLVPVTLGMLVETQTGENLFSHLGGMSSGTAVREGRIRAKGPFRHAILAGTIAASLLPVAVAVYREKRRVAILGMLAMLLAVFACASSGPIITLAAAAFGLAFWFQRIYLAMALWAGVALLLFLHFCMEDPVWFLIARVGIVGGSTGWHRARLIDSAIAYLGEWWFAGTDQTSHWMHSSTMRWSEKHMDITNYYIKCGVIGGLPLMVSVIWLLKTSFSEVGRAVKSALPDAPSHAFLYWSLGSCLFAHSVSMMGVNYYDQSLVLFFGIVGTVGSLSQVVPAADAVNPTGACTSLWETCTNDELQPT